MIHLLYIMNYDLIIYYLDTYYIASVYCKENKMDSTFDYQRPDRDDDEKYAALFRRLNELCRQDSMYMQDIDDCIRLEDMVALLPLSAYSRQIIHDYIACLLTLSERQTEIAYELGKADVK